MYSGSVVLLAAAVAGASYAAGWGIGAVDLTIKKEPGGEYKGMTCERINVHAEVPEWLFGTVVSSFEAKDLNLGMSGPENDHWTIFSRSAINADPSDANMLVSPLYGVGTTTMVVEVKANVNFVGREIPIAREIKTVTSECISTE